MFFVFVVSVFTNEFSVDYGVLRYTIPLCMMIYFYFIKELLVFKNQRIYIMTSQNYYEQKGGAGFYGFIVFALCSCGML